MEHVLQDLQREAQTYPARKNHLAAIQFYLQSMLLDCETEWKRLEAMGVTNYKTILDQIECWRIQSNERVCLVTFNYDTMLEDALPGVEIKIGSINDYITSNPYKIIKLHGSVNWAHEVKASEDDTKKIQELPLLSVANDLIARRGYYDVLSDFRLVSWPLADPKRHQHGPPLFPALAIPLEVKHKYECPETHLNELQNCVRNVDKMLLVGWRATEELFLQLLKDRLTGVVHIMTVAENLNAARETKNRLGAVGIEAKFIEAEVGFSDFVLQDQIEELLAR